MVGSWRSYICCRCGGDKGIIYDGQGFDGDNEKEEEDKGFVFGIGVKGEEKELREGVFCKREKGEVALAGHVMGEG